MSRRRGATYRGGTARKPMGPVASRCDVCGSQGYCYLGPVDPPDDMRFACPLCLARLRRAREARQDKDGPR